MVTVRTFRYHKKDHRTRHKLEQKQHKVRRQTGRQAGGRRGATLILLTIASPPSSPIMFHPGSLPIQAQLSTPPGIATSENAPRSGAVSRMGEGEGEGAGSGETREAPRVGGGGLAVVHVSPHLFL